MKINSTGILVISLAISSIILASSAAYNSHLTREAVKLTIKATKLEIKILEGQCK